MDPMLGATVAEARRRATAQAPHRPLAVTADKDLHRLAAEVRGALGGAVQASRCGNVDTESHAASVSSLTLQPPELLPQLGEPVRRRSSSRRPKARQPSPPIVFPCSGARISLFGRRNSLFDAREFPVPARREFGP